MKHDGTERLPFLNMARSLGDYWSARDTEYIISPEPDVSVHDIQDSDFIVLGTDGVWDVLSPQEAADVVHEVDRSFRLF